jgi:hypothetical protein
MNKIIESVETHIAVLKGIARNCCGKSAFHQSAIFLLSCCALAILASPSVTIAKAPKDSKPVPKAVESPTDKALIYIYRENGLVGAAAYEAVFINDTFLVSLHKGRYVSKEVPPGKTVFSVLPGFSKVMIGYATVASLVKKPKEMLSIEVEAGKTYYVKRYISGLTSKYKLMDEKSGAKEMSKLKLAKDKDMGDKPKFR